MDLEDSPGPSTSNQASLVKKTKIPPIIVTQKDFKSNVISDLNLPDITFKFISLGLKISFGNMDSYDKCIEFLSKKNIEFFTHRVKNNIFKVVLSGLPQLNTDDIKVELNSRHNLNILDVRELQTSYYNKNSRLYLISLENKDINLAQLRQIKDVNHTIVNWLRFSPKFKGPIQCRRCLMFGHGAENCHRKILCMFCASSEHASENCSFNKVPAGQVVNFNCGNCKSRGMRSNHKANDPSCPCKIEFENIRNHVRVKNSNRSHQSHQRNRVNQMTQSNLRSTTPNQNAGNQSNQRSHLNANAPEFTLNANQFPSLSNNRQQSSSQSFDFKNSYANVSKNQLLSVDEFFNVFEDALVKFYECRTAAEQIALIASLLRRAIR